MVGDRIHTERMYAPNEGLEDAHILRSLLQGLIHLAIDLFGEYKSPSCVTRMPLGAKQRMDNLGFIVVCSVGLLSSYKDLVYLMTGTAPRQLLHNGPSIELCDSRGVIHRHVVPSLFRVCE